MDQAVEELCCVDPEPHEPKLPHPTEQLIWKDHSAAPVAKLVS